MLLQDGQATPDIAADSVNAVSEAVSQYGEQLRGWLSHWLPVAGSADGSVSLVNVALVVGLLLMMLLVRLLLLKGAARLLDVDDEGEMEQRPVAAVVFKLIGDVLLLLAIFVGVTLLNLPQKPLDWNIFALRGWMTVALVLAAQLSYTLLSLQIRLLGRTRLAREHEGLFRQLRPLLNDALKIAIGIFSVVLLIQIWGYNAGALLAGLGIGGLAFAFAAQNSIANIFGTVVIFTDRPYKVGDFIRIGETEGWVEKIGVRSTRIRQLDTNIVTVPNAMIADTEIVNITESPMRNIRFTVGLLYSHDAEVLERALSGIRAITAEHEGLVRGMGWVHFDEFGASSQDILVNVFADTTDIQRYMEIKEGLLLKVRREMDAIGAGFAFPSRSIYLEDSPGLERLRREE
ncbi:mechanosensitive ion channel family protein [bacterium]|nr:mechanosensitive ion channel family protein [bacterium]